MKRNAAIIGPTPAFLRWAIHHACPLREIELESLPNSTFRQLRSLSELSASLLEGRVMEGVAFHPDTLAVGAEGPLLGFPVDEIAEAFGGQDYVQSHCGSCPANCLSAAEGWAGCFGLVQIVDPVAVSQQVESIAAAKDVFSQLQQQELLIYGKGNEWYGLWRDRIVTPQRAKLLRLCLEDLRDRSDEWEALCVAVDRCIEHNLDLHVELYPTGVSDGQKWSLDPHCETCKAPLDGRHSDMAGKVCQVCGQKLIGENQKKRKVLGLRPYMHLKHIYGAEKCEELRQRYLDFVRASADRITD